MFYLQAASWPHAQDARTRAISCVSPSVPIVSRNDRRSKRATGNGEKPSEAFQWDAGKIPARLSLERAQEAQEPVKDGQRTRRTARNEQIDRHEAARAVADLGEPANSPPEMAQAPTTTTTLGSGVAS